MTLLSKSKNLRNSQTFNTVFVSPDISGEERVARRALVFELKEKRKGEATRNSGSIQEARPSMQTSSRTSTRTSTRTGLRTGSAIPEPVREPVRTSYDIITSRSQIADANCRMKVVT